MRRLIRSRPSPAMVVSCVALFAALTGGAIALPGKNSVTSNDIKKGAVRTSDIKNSTIRGKDVRNGTLKGNDVDEDSLGKVPSAGSADSANNASNAANANSARVLDGYLSAAKVNLDTVPTFTNRQILDFGGLTLTASCTISGNVLASTILTVDASSSVANSRISIGNVAAGNPSDDDTDGQPNTSTDNNSIWSESTDLDPGETFSVLPNVQDTQGTLTYTRPDGVVITVTYRSEESGNILFPTRRCGFQGNAIGG